MVLMVFINQTNWCLPMSIYEILKVVFEITFFIAIIFIFMRYKKIRVDDYVDEWKSIKKNENDINGYLEILHEMPEEVKLEFFKEVLRQAEKEYQRTGENPFKI